MKMLYFILLSFFVSHVQAKAWCEQRSATTYPSPSGVSINNLHVGQEILLASTQMVIAHLDDTPGNVTNRKMKCYEGNVDSGNKSYEVSMYVNGTKLRACDSRQVLAQDQIEGQEYVQTYNIEMKLKKISEGDLENPVKLPSGKFCFGAGPESGGSGTCVALDKCGSLAPTPDAVIGFYP